MFADATSRNKIISWTFRGAGTASVSFGAFLPISAVGSAFGTIPFLGPFATAAAGIAGLACFVVGLAISLLVIGISWLVVRPIVGGSVLASSIFLGAGITYLVRHHHHHAKTRDKLVAASDEELSI
jgi:hypothetical protein